METELKTRQNKIKYLNWKPLVTEKKKKHQQQKTNSKSKNKIRSTNGAIWSCYNQKLAP